MDYDIKCHPSRIKLIKRRIYKWSKADMNAIKNGINEDVSSFCRSSSITIPIDELWNNFQMIVKNAMDKIPSKETSNRYSQPWFTRECKKLSRQKKRAYNKV